MSFLGRIPDDGKPHAQLQTSLYYGCQDRSQVFFQNVFFPKCIFLKCIMIVKIGVRY